MYLFIHKIMTISTGDSRSELQVHIREHANYMNMYAINIGDKDTDIENTYKQVTIKTKNFFKKLENYGKNN